MLRSFKDSVAFWQETYVQMLFNLYVDFILDFKTAI